MINDQTKLVEEAKNDKASHCCCSAYQKKIGRNGIKQNEIMRNEIRRNVIKRNEITRNGNG